MKKTLLLLLGVWITSIFSVYAGHALVTSPSTLATAYTAANEGIY